MKTKNSIMLSLAIMLISTSAIAQINFGLRSGIAASTFSDKGNLYDDHQITLSYTGGAFATIPVIKSFAIQPELNYVRKGRSNETAELGTSVETDFMLHYLEVPVLFQYRNDQMLNKSSSVFFINAGPYAAFALNTQTRVSETTEGGVTVPVGDSKNTDWGATMGIGFQTPVLKKNICFDLRYDMGMSEIAEQPTVFRTKCLSLTVGIVL
ncbi:MAG: porin family protein [Bacteroidota bacterium]